MAPSSVLVFDNNLALESDFNDFHEFNNSYPNFVLQKDCSQKEKQISVDPISIRSVSSSAASSMRIDSFNIMLPPAMSPPRDSTVPLPFPPTPVKFKKKLSKQESLLFLKKRNSNNNNNNNAFRQLDKKIRQSESFDSYDEDEVKCGPFCMFLPSFGKTKPVKSFVKRDDYFSIEKKSLTAISTRVSMEKFECGSWASSVLAHENEIFFSDFPAVEMVKRSSGELHKPVSSGFVFHKEPAAVVKSVLKTSKSSRRSAESSPRRVRFSTTSSSLSVSCPTSPRSCITPRLRKAREDFNALLEAQNA